MKKLLKKTSIEFLTVILLFVSVLFIGKNSEAAGISEAISYTMGSTQRGLLTGDENGNQYYKFYLSSSGEVKLTGTLYIERVYMYIYDSAGNELWRKVEYCNSTSEIIALNESVYLTSGTYYLCFSEDSYSGNYNFSMSLNSSNESFPEVNGGSNNSIASADKVSTNGTLYRAQLALNDEKDFWRFDLDKSGVVKFSSTFYKIDNISWALYDEKGIELKKEHPYCNSVTNDITINEDLYLTKGTYYLSTSFDYWEYSGKYDFSLKFTSANETYTETNNGSNNSINTANELLAGVKYKGQIAINDEKDFYRLDVYNTTYTIRVQAEMEVVYIYLFDSNGTKVWGESIWCDSTTNTIDYSNVLKDLDNGTYYIAIDGGEYYYGNYTLSVSGLTSSNCSHENFETEWHDATFFSKGYRVYTCEDCGYSYKSDYMDKRELSDGYLYSYSTVGKGSLKLYWSCEYDATGYQIRYSKNKNMSNASVKKVKGADTTQKVIKVSRKKVYYVQIRPYKSSGGQTVYGKWSGKRKLKTK